MIQTKISVTEFLERALRASADGARPVAEYAAMMVIAARTADRPQLQDQILERWNDLDDLTNDRIMIVAPATGGGTAVPWPGGDPVALVAEGIDVHFRRQSSHWRRAFFAEAPERNERSLLRAMEHVPIRPDGDVARAGFTSTASEIARFFGLRELELPSVVLLSFWEREGFVLPVRGGFDLYGFLKRVVDAYGDGGVGLVSAREDEADARYAALLAERDVQRLRERQVNVVNNWHRQRDAVGELIERLARARPMAADSARRLSVLIKSGRKPSARHVADADRVIAAAQEPTDEDATLFRLAERLPKVLKKLEHGWPGADPDFAQLAARIADANARVEDRTREHEVSVARLEQVKREVSFSAAVHRAAEAELLREEARTQDWRPDWRLVTLHSAKSHAVGRSHQ